MREALRILHKVMMEIRRHLATLFFFQTREGIYFYSHVPMSFLELASVTSLMSYDQFCYCIAGYLKFGLNREKGGIVYREWAPAAQ